jgi:flagellar biosynthesis protein FlhF
MKTKSFYASSLEKAIHDARQELGAEAVLITSRRVPSESHSVKSYEVVFGAAEVAASPHPVPQSHDIQADLAALEGQLEGIKRALKLNEAASPASAEDVLLDRAQQELVAAGMSATVARDIVAKASVAWNALAPMQRASAASLKTGLLECLSKELRFAPTARPGDSSRVMVFVGPPGAGKTTTLMKVAIQEFFARRISVRIVSVDPHRPAGHEKARALAGIIGVGFSAVNTMAEFADAIEEFQGKGVLLIDTPGYGRSDEDDLPELEGFLSKLGSRGTHLVLSASMKGPDLIRAARQYAGLAPDYLLFTKLDETESYGGILSTALEVKKPLSFFADGQSIPEDIEAASSSILLAPLFEGRRAEAISAA